MATVRVAILDPSGNKRTHAEVPENVESQRLVTALVNRMGLPQVGQDGRPIRYRLNYTREGQETELNPAETLADAGIQNDAVLRLYTDMQAVPINVERIYTLLEELSSQIRGVGSEQTVQTIRQEIEDGIALIAARITIPDAIPIIIHDREKEPIPMVRADRLHIIEEYRAEQNKWFSIAWALIGAAFGVIVNWATSETMAISSASVVVIITFGVIGGLAWLSARQFQKRAERYKHIVLYGSEDAGELSEAK